MPIFGKLRCPLQIPAVDFRDSENLSYQKTRIHPELRGGGVHPDYFVKLDFEIAVDQQTRARDRTFKGVPDSG